LANEITVSATLKYAKAKVSVSQGTTFVASQTGDKYEAGIQAIGTTEEALAKGDVGTIGYLAVRNMDLTNFVQLGVTTGVYTVKLKPGEGAVVPWNASTALIKADTAQVEVEYLMIEA
jgi:hypothetical protein